MDFRLEQVFPGPLEVVEAALVDPGFLERLGQLPKLGRPELLDQREEGPLLRQRVRYRFVGDLSRAVTRVVDPARLTWVEELTLDRRSHQSTFRILPDHYGDRLQCTATMQLSPAGDGSTRRLTLGDLTVRMPLVGRRVERAILSGMAEHSEAEVQVMAQWLGEHRP